MSILDANDSPLSIGDTVVIVGGRTDMFRGRRAEIVNLEDCRFAVKVQIDSFKDVPYEPHNVVKLPSENEVAK